MRKQDELKHLSFGWFVTPEEVEKLSFWDFLKHQRFGLVVGACWGFVLAFLIFSMILRKP